MNGSSRASFHVLLPLVLVVAVLYLGREFFIPLALAVLISFLLAPLIKKLERLKIGRVASVLAATMLAFSVIGGLGYIVGGQLIDLAKELPNYKTNLRAKVEAFRGTKSGALSKATQTLQEVTNEMTAEAPPTSTHPTPGSDITQKSTVEPPPVPVKVIYKPGSALDTVWSYVVPLIGPLGMAALVIVFVIFILLELEDLRDRVIHLIGRGHLRVTTQAINDAGGRVSRYLFAQLIVNVTYGIPVGIGLYFIGIPNAVLFGLLAAVFRFIPYLGPCLGAAFPIFLSLAISPSWNTPLLTIGLFVVIELISNNAVEPWLYGSSTGLSPIAVIVSAAFWTWLWGPIGLLLATPLTVCLAVLGKYIPDLNFIDVLLGDRPPIAQEDRFYQRLLARDEEEICELAEKYLGEHNLDATFDELIIPALRMAESDFRAGVLTESTRAEMHQLVQELIESLGVEDTSKPSRNAAGKETPTEILQEEEVPAVFCLPSCSQADELAALMLARILIQHDVAVKVCASKLLTNEMVEQAVASSSRLFCVSVLPPASVLPASLVCRRLREKLPDARITVGLWDETALNDRRRKRFEQSRADMVYTSLRVASRELASQAEQLTPREVAAEPVDQ